MKEKAWLRIGENHKVGVTTKSMVDSRGGLLVKCLESLVSKQNAACVIPQLASSAIIILSHSEPEYMSIKFGKA